MPSEVMPAKYLISWASRGQGMQILTLRIPGSNSGLPCFYCSDANSIQAHGHNVAGMGKCDEPGQVVSKMVR